MTAGCFSSLVGFVITWRHDGSSSPRQQAFTLQFTLASDIASFVVALAGAGVGLLRGAGRRTPKNHGLQDTVTVDATQVDEPDDDSNSLSPSEDSEHFSETAALVSPSSVARSSRLPPLRVRTVAVLGNFCHGRFSAWFWLYALTRAVHTWIITLWSSLASDLAPGGALAPEAWIGLVGAAMYMLAVVPVAALPRTARILTDGGTGVLASCLLLLLGGALACASATTTLLQLGLAMCVYNAAAETLLALAAARLARSIVCQPASPLYETHYLGTMLLRFVAATILGSVLSLVFMPKWFTLANMFGVHLSLAQQFLAFGCASLCALPAAVVAARLEQRVARRLATGQLSSPTL